MIKTIERMSTIMTRKKEEKLLNHFLSKDFDLYFGIPMVATKVPFPPLPPPPSLFAGVLSVGGAGV